MKTKPPNFDTFLIYTFVVPPDYIYGLCFVDQTVSLKAYTACHCDHNPMWATIYTLHGRSAINHVLKGHYCCDVLLW